MRENEVATKVLDAAFKIHRAVGPGLLETVYETLLVYELQRVGLSVQKQVPIPVVYEDIKLPDGFRADLIVEGCLIVEVKSVEQLAPVHTMQVSTYLRFADMRLELLINFNTAQLKDGIKRVANRMA